MRKILTSLIIGSAFFASSNLATAGSSRGYKTDIVTVPASSIRVEVVLSEDLAYRANNLPKKTSDRNSSRGLRAGFANNGFLGDKDLERLVAKLEDLTTRKLEKRGIDVDEEAKTVLKLTLVDAKPNRPTFKQLSEQSSLSFDSFSFGGAEIEGELFLADGASQGKLSYRYYETFRDGFERSAGVWQDTRRTIERFSSRLAKDFAKRRTQSGA